MNLLRNNSSDSDHFERENLWSRHAKILVVAASLFLFFVIAGDFGPHWMANNRCYSFLGCNAGFFGYDVCVHFFSGMLNVVIILWLARISVHCDVFHNNRFWKNFLILMSICALIAVSWEIMEFCFDYVRMAVFHINLLTPNHLAQPSNADTVGDMTINLLGGALAAGISKLFAPEIVWHSKK